LSKVKLGEIIPEASATRNMCSRS